MCKITSGIGQGFGDFCEIKNDWKLLPTEVLKKLRQNPDSKISVFRCPVFGSPWPLGARQCTRLGAAARGRRQHDALILELSWWKLPFGWSDFADFHSSFEATSFHHSKSRGLMDLILSVSSHPCNHIPRWHRQARQAFNPNAVTGCFIWEYLEAIWTASSCALVLCFFRFQDLMPPPVR